MQCSISIHTVFYREDELMDDDDEDRESEEEDEVKALN